MEEETILPTSEDVVIKEEYSLNSFQNTIYTIVGVIMIYFIYKHFIAKESGYLAISLVDNRNAFADLLYIFFAGLAVYIIFLIYGIVISVIASKTKCDKTDFTVSAKESALFAVNPMVCYVFIRLVEALRIHYDKILSTIGLNNPIWSISAFVSTWVIFKAIELVSDSEQKACVSTEEEARKYKEKFLKNVKDKELNGK